MRSGSAGTACGRRNGAAGRRRQPPGGRAGEDEKELSRPAAETAGPAGGRWRVVAAAAANAVTARGGGRGPDTGWEVRPGGRQERPTQVSQEWSSTWAAWKST